WRVEDADRTRDLAMVDRSGSAYVGEVTRHRQSGPSGPWAIGWNEGRIQPNPDESSTAITRTRSIVHPRRSHGHLLGVESPMSRSADRNLLFGLLALQLNFIDRDALVDAFHRWVSDRSKPLDKILQDRGALRPDEHDLLQALVAKHLEKFG